MEHHAGSHRAITAAVHPARCSWLCLTVVADASLLVVPSLRLQLRQRTGDDSAKGDEDDGGYQDAQDALEEMIEEVRRMAGFFS